MRHVTGKSLIVGTFSITWRTVLFLNCLNQDAGNTSFTMCRQHLLCNLPTLFPYNYNLPTQHLLSNEKSQPSQLRNTVIIPVFIISTNIAPIIGTIRNGFTE